MSNTYDQTERGAAKRAALMKGIGEAWAVSGDVGLTVRKSKGETTSQTIYTWYGSIGKAIAAYRDLMLSEFEAVLEELRPTEEPAQAAGVLLDFLVDRPAHRRALAEHTLPGLGKEPSQAVVELAPIVLGLSSAIGSLATLYVVVGLAQGCSAEVVEPAAAAEVLKMVCAA